MPTLSEADDTSVPPPRASAPWGRGLFVVGVLGLLALEAYFYFTAEVRDPVHLPVALAILFFAALPALLWARRGRASLPIFETMMLTGANAYALPLLNGHSQLVFYAPEDITTAGLAVLVFQIVALGAYEFTRGRPSTHPFWRESVISDDLGRWLTYGMLLNSGYVIVSTFTDLIPLEIGSILRAVFFGIGIVCTFITARRLGEGRLSPGEKLFFLANLFIQCGALVSTLYLVGAVSLLLLALVGFVSGSGRIPLLVPGLALLALGVLHNGKDEMRDKYWEGGRTQPALGELPAYFSEWVGYGLRKDDPADEEKIAGKLIERTSLFHIMCLVVSTTPHSQPFLDGETYRDIPAQFVPRLLWPEKPPGHVSTSKLSVYYGLQTEEDTLTTTIGFGMLCEAYANFGWWGLAALGAFFGVGIKKVQSWALESPLFSYGGLITVILLAWSFQVEFTLSLWLASLYQACLAVLLIPFALRRLLGR